MDIIFLIFFLSVSIYFFQSLNTRCFFIFVSLLNNLFCLCIVYLTLLNCCFVVASLNCGQTIILNSLTLCRSPFPWVWFLINYGIFLHWFHVSLIFCVFPVALHFFMLIWWCSHFLWNGQLRMITPHRIIVKTINKPLLPNYINIQRITIVKFY